MIDEIAWSKLKPYKHTVNRSFEELCYCLAKKLYSDMGQFTSIDDSGGGDGVEFYLTLRNGDQWGWQAKFYHPSPRLEESSRKASIKTSLKVACQKHPALKKWFLCTPTNFTEKEQQWFDQELTSLVPQCMDVRLQHWSDSDILDMLEGVS